LASQLLTGTKAHGLFGKKNSQSRRHYSGGREQDRATKQTRGVKRKTFKERGIFFAKRGGKMLALERGGWSYREKTARGLIPL